MKTSAIILLLFISLLPAFSFASLQVGVSKADLTPPIGTPSAGYMERHGQGMKGVHDPLEAISLFIDNGEKKMALCSVDHLGFTYEMVQEICQKVHQELGLEQCEIYIGSSHTHSGGGAYLNIPTLGKTIAGPFNQAVTQLYIDRTVEAIIKSSQDTVPAKIGIGYGKAENLSRYRAMWPLEVNPCFDVAVIKVTGVDGTPLAALFNFAVHPTILNSQNRLFSADLVGYARDHLQTLLGLSVQPLFFNGAQGDIAPIITKEEDRFASCAELGQSLAETVEKIWHDTEINDFLHIQTQKEPYSFKPETTPYGLTLPLESYQSEINALIFNHRHAFITIPGELSTIYDRQLKEVGRRLGYAHVSILGLTNDAHGYIITPESWKYKTSESSLSFGGENYGELTKSRAEALLKDNID